DDNSSLFACEVHTLGGELLFASDNVANEKFSLRRLLEEHVLPTVRTSTRVYFDEVIGTLSR
ncbi:unnamed protein product, partial [Amoebophrya sp. A25]